MTRRVVRVHVDTDMSNEGLSACFASWMEYLMETNPEIAKKFDGRMLVESGRYRHLIEVEPGAAQ